MTIKVIVELRAHPGQRDELRTVFENMLAAHGSEVPGFLGSSRYEKLDDPDVLVEIADWASAEAREAHLKDAATAETVRRLGLPTEFTLPVPESERLMLYPLLDTEWTLRTSASSSVSSSSVSFSLFSRH